MFEWHPDGRITIHADPPAARDTLPRTYLTILTEAAERLLDADDPAEMVDQLFARIAQELRLDVFFNYRIEGDLLVLEAHGGLTERQATEGATLRVGQAICGTVARDRCKMHATAIQSSRDPALGFVRDAGLDAYACTPLIHGGMLIGTLGFGRRWAGRFDADELSLLHAVCHYVAIAKYRLRMEAALRDGLERQERLLQELNHRVRNALQLAISVVGMEFGPTSADDIEAVRRRAVSRLEVMAIAHRPLYSSSQLNDVDVRTLIADVAEQTTGRATAVAAEGVYSLPVERAVALALVVHAMLLDMPGLRAIALGRRDTEDGARLAITLSGDLPDGSSPMPRTILMLLRQLHGTIDRDRSGVTICFAEGAA